MARIAETFERLKQLFSENENTRLTAKEKQLAFVKTYLKPLLKQHGYSTNAQTWWRDQGEFFIVINLQNFSWNSKDDVSFCFNIGIALKAAMKEPDSKKASYNDLTVHIREGAYLPDSRKKHGFQNNNGYMINAKSNYSNFVKELEIDFEQEILPRLDGLKTVADCLDFYGNFPFWGDHLKRIVSENALQR